MLGFPRIPRALWAAALLLASAAGLSGDTIVLKNGRRIVAANVIEEGGKIRYETPSGTLTLPRSIVDHVERGGFAPAAGDGLSLKPPLPDAGSRASGGAIDQRVIVDDEVDRNYVAALEGQARGGDPEASRRAAAAHHAASQFELAHGDMELALADERTALTYAPGQPVFLLNLAYLHLRRSEFTQSLDYLERARRASPDDPEVAKLSGWAYYGLNKLDQAVAEWQRAVRLRPDAEVEAALGKALRDKKEEEQYRENESSHFTLRYSGASEPSLARDVLRALERHYGAVESELGYSPPDSIGVILYTQQGFRDITRAPAWAGATNDGRIRVPVQGLSEVTPELSRVLKHELTHSFLQQKTQGRAPTWMQEGLAQWMEGKRSGGNAPALLEMYRRTPELVGAHFEGDWMSLPGEAAGVAYAWALADVEYIVAAGGMGDVERILERLAAGEATEAALKAVLRSGYGDLSRETADYLRKTYPR